MLLSDYDWSENGTILNAVQIQSEYWSLVHYSLFISITSHLVVAKWLDRSSFLQVGSEVTVEPHEKSVDGSLEPAVGSLYGTVVRCPLESDERSVHEIYHVVTDGSLNEVAVSRERLRHRVKHRIAFVGITDEKRHDAATTQHFLNKQFRYWKQHQDRNALRAWIGHSDNASHFKSGPMMHFWSKKLQSEDFLQNIWIEFGCPGHGKGPWDGMGAVMKQQLTRDLTNSKILTDTGCVASPREAAEHLQRRFETEAWRHGHSDKPIKKIKVFYSHHNEIFERTPIEHEFDSLSGKM